MQQSEVIDIKQALISLRNLSLNINSKLRDEANTDLAETIARLYSDRMKLINEIKNWQNSEKGAKFIEISADTFKKGIEEVQKIEDENIALIKNRYQSTGNKLKKLIKQKSILIYTREK